MAYSPPTAAGYYPPTTYPPTPNPSGDEYVAFNTVPAPSYYEADPFSYGFPGGAAVAPVAHDLPRNHSPGLDTAVAFANGNARSSSEEKELLTPSQRRRKEQNRAAQRAFRERKERHVRDLESRLATLESAHALSLSENSTLREALEKTKLENRLLQETRADPAAGLTTGPLRYTPLDNRSSPASTATPSVAASAANSAQSSPPGEFTGALFKEHPNKGPLHRITVSPESGERLLGAGAAWEMILCHPLYEEGKVDIAMVSERLRKVARCDGQGPVFEEGAVLDAIQESAVGEDDLL